MLIVRGRNREQGLVGFGGGRGCRRQGVAVGETGGGGKRVSAGIREQRGEAAGGGSSFFIAKLKGAAAGATTSVPLSHREQGTRGRGAAPTPPCWE